MATFIEGGKMAFDAALFGVQPAENMQFIRQQFQTIGHHLTDAAAQFIESTRVKMEELSQTYAAQLIRSAGRALDAFWLPDEILHLNNIGHMQYAPPTMQRWIMACPEVRELYQQGRIEGYGETYTDHDPGRIGAEHYDYRRATNGVVLVDNTADEEGNYGWHATTYDENLKAGDRDLELVEQADILNTWRNIRPMLGAGMEDPTSRWGADIG